MLIKQSNNGKLPLVLLHGWGVNSGVWDFVLPQLTLWFDVIRIDLPGFGFNQHKLPRDYQLTALCDLIVPLCPANSILAGWSLGGLVATQMALQHPERFRALCLIASSPCFVDQPQWKGIKPAVLQQFSDALTGDSERTVSRFLAIQAMGSDSAKQDVKRIKAAVFNAGAPPMPALLGGLGILQNTDLRQSMAELTLPVHGIFGRLDSLVPIRSIEQLAVQHPQFSFQIIGKAAHAPFISHQTEFVAALKQLYGTEFAEYNQRL